MVLVRLAATALLVGCADDALSVSPPGPDQPVMRDVVVGRDSTDAQSGDIFDEPEVAADTGTVEPDTDPRDSEDGAPPDADAGSPTDVDNDATCGNGVCEPSESPLTCPSDCGPYCGDSLCEPGESVESCPVDCLPICGDGRCEPPENRATCTADCRVCGDGFCDVPENATSCAVDCGPRCGNGLCEVGESAVLCPTDCGSCGDGYCDGTESVATCPADCLICGDGVCYYAELYECPLDCGSYQCGDGVCWDGESFRGCRIDCDSGEPFGADWEKPDVFIIGVSGHSVSPPNDEYLDDQGTLQRIAQEFERSGFTVDTLGYADQFYNLDDSAREFAPPSPGVDSAEYGFLMLLRDLAEIRDRFIIGQAEPTSLIIVAHSHGAVWAHMAIYYLLDLPVDVLVTLDGESLGWRGDGLSFIANDNWRSVISSYSRTRGVLWPLGLDASDPVDAFDIPGVASLQDIEDVVPDNVVWNLETSGDYSFAAIRDGDPSHRLDGSFRGIVSMQFDESHDDLDGPYSETMDWVVEQIRLRYGLF